MSNVIQFLEAVGKDAALGRLATPEYLDAVSRLEVDHELRDALARKDTVALKRLLGASDTLMMLLFRKEEDAPQEEERKDDDSPGDTKSSLGMAQVG